MSTLPWHRVRADLLDEAVGHSHRTDPVLRRTGGPAGNARLTAWTGAVLLVLFLAELVTLLDVRGLVAWHIALGVLLLPPALLKTASTGWRILRYYTGNRPYRTAGPPILPLRILGPVVVLTTLGLLGSGLVLIGLGAQRSEDDEIAVLGQRFSWVNVHAAFFVVCGIATALHLLARFMPAVALWSGRYRTDGDRVRVPGGAPRLAVLALTLAVAAVAAVLLLPTAGSWQHDRFDRFGHDHHRPPVSVDR